MTTMQLYWIVKLTDIQLFFCILGSCTITAGIISVIAIALGEERLSKLFSWVTITGIVLAFIGTLIPSTKQMAAILILPSVINNEQIQEMPAKLLELGNEWIEELKPKK